MMWTGLLILIILVSAYLRLPLLLWSLMLGSGLVVCTVFSDVSTTQLYLMWLIYAAIIIPLNLKPLRRNLISRAIYSVMKKMILH